MKFEKSILDNVFGLSCIENYLLYIMKSSNYEYKHLFHESFISFGELAKAFFEENVKYAYFDKIRRLQSVACEYELIKLHITAGFRKEVLKYDFCCVQVTSDYVKKQYGKEAWRDDHYILYH